MSPNKEKISARPADFFVRRYVLKRALILAAILHVSKHHSCSYLKESGRKGVKRTMPGPIFSPAGTLLGILTDHAIIDSSGVKVAYVRSGNIFSEDSIYLGRIIKMRGRMVWVKY